MFYSYLSNKSFTGGGCSSSGSVLGAIPLLCLYLYFTHQGEGLSCQGQRPINEHSYFAIGSKAADDLRVPRQARG